MKPQSPLLIYLLFLQEIRNARIHPIYFYQWGRGSPGVRGGAFQYITLGPDSALGDPVVHFVNQKLRRMTKEDEKDNISEIITSQTSHSTLANPTARKILSERNYFDQLSREIERAMGYLFIGQPRVQGRVHTTVL
ncbi:hypothetical protein AVEN_146585-1 [Araneus ventricosus]|uniref:Uncharacterized protein n=1 Tax=Araneus ventricosus TaxID=182803 RepID=A0A4Y2H5Q3_ARAVE|nr:hypothetical protein AVEN_146585-1 [Araneus ventricosus]